MSPVNNPNQKPSWLRDIWNGFLAWVIAFVVYMLPSVVVAISMGFDLGPKLNNNAEVSRRISQAISEMYQSSLYLRVGYIFVLAILVFWRSWVTTRHFTERSILHAGTIGSAAAILVAVQMTLSGAGMHMVIPVVVSIAAGLVGGMKRVLRGTAQ